MKKCVHLQHICSPQATLSSPEPTPQSYSLQKGTTETVESSDNNRTDPLFSFTFSVPLLQPFLSPRDTPRSIQIKPKSR